MHRHKGLNVAVPLEPVAGSGVEKVSDKHSGDVSATSGVTALDRLSLVVHGASRSGHVEIAAAHVLAVGAVRWLGSCRRRGGADEDHEDNDEMHDRPRHVHFLGFAVRPLEPEIGSDSVHAAAGLSPMERTPRAVDSAENSGGDALTDAPGERGPEPPETGCSGLNVLDLFEEPSDLVRPEPAVPDPA